MFVADRTVLTARQGEGIPSERNDREPEGYIGNKRKPAPRCSSE